MDYGKKIYDDRFQTIYLGENGNIMTMYWEKGTEGMGYSQFQGALHIFSGFCQQKQCDYAIIDSGEFMAVDMLIEAGGEEMKEMWAWRTKNVAPVYNAAGIKRFAFTNGPEGEMFGYEEQQFPGEDFPTKVCHSPEEAMEWLKS